LSRKIESIVKKEFDDEINTSGILAVLYAAEISNARHIYTAGIDFYEPGLTGYVSSDDPSQEVKKKENRAHLT
jgi:hypothetical protein